MLRRKKILKRYNILKKNQILESFYIDKKKENVLSKYIDCLAEYNSHTNLVGKSTLENPWNSHILDSIQILPIINNKKSLILDMGTGAGFPGSVLSIAGCVNVLLADSNSKKIKFLKQTKDELNLTFDIFLGRVEEMESRKFDIITSRALAKLTKLFSYSQKFIKKNSVLIFLKGKAVNEELLEARKNWKFICEKKQSLSDARGSILIIRDLTKK